ncbi:hypothetical protein TELCIR_11863 [Teladorsagia circumcincta]|uniref:CHK kinase-like domain-containing protein n=1 Tax=Teladorsagia circumcincta TaxID=45464 RepID=A0A2G9U887_TELCI|nr:hypothetical protein TELCIR_11863 [Teladorsagia circumcincta]
MVSENLYTPAEGLFDTHVTWEDIEEDMQRELDTAASFGPQKSVNDIGDGNIVTQLVMQKFTKEISKQKSHNNNFINPRFMADYEKLQKRGHNTEVAVFEYLERIPEGKINVPKKFSESNPAKGYMIMEYLENIKEVHVFDNVTPTQLKQVLHYKAVLEAYSLDISLEERKEFVNEPFDNVYNRMFKQEVQANIVHMFESLKASKLTESAKRLEKIIPDMLDFKWAENLADELVKGYMIMEYLENIKEVHVFDNVTPTQLKQVLHYKAVLEAYSLDISLEERKEFVNEPFDNVYNRMFKQEVQANIVHMFESLKASKLTESAKRLKKIIPDMLDFKWAENLADELGMDRVLCHGDLWSMNILWESSKDGPRLGAVIDYQTAHFGCSATDLVRMFSACLSGKERRAHWEELLEEFYGYLKEEVGEREMPYTIEQLKEAYRRYFPIGAFMIVAALGPLFEVIFKNEDETDKKQCLERVMEKTECLLEDIFYYYDRNVKIQNGKSAD